MSSRKRYSTSTPAALSATASSATTNDRGPKPLAVSDASEKRPLVQRFSEASLTLGKQIPQQFLLPAIVGDDYVGARPHQAVALPGVDALAAHLVAGHRHRHPSHPLDLLDF